MVTRNSRILVNLLFLLPWVLVSGCTSKAAPGPASQTEAAPAADTVAIAERLKAIAASGNFADLHAPNFTDYRLHVQHMYTAVNYAPVWVRDGQVTPQALAIIAALEASQHKGLNPEDYD